MKLKENDMRKDIVSALIVEQQPTGLESSRRSISTGKLLLDSWSLEMLKIIRALQKEGVSLKDSVVRAKAEVQLLHDKESMNSDGLDLGEIGAFTNLLLMNSGRLSHIEDALESISSKLDEALDVAHPSS